MERRDMICEGWVGVSGSLSLRTSAGGVADMLAEIEIV